MGALLFCLLPPLLYCVTTFGLAWGLQHVWSLLLLASAPPLMLTTMQVSHSRFSSKAVSVESCHPVIIFARHNNWSTRRIQPHSAYPAYTVHFLSQKRTIVPTLTLS